MTYRLTITIDKKRYMLNTKAKSMSHALKIISKQARKYGLDNRIAHIHLLEICK